MPIDMPTTPGFVSCQFGLETNTQKFESDLTKNVQRALLSGARWRAVYTLPKMNRSQAAVWQSFFLRCEGGVNSFNAYDPDCVYPRGPASGTPLVKGASQTGSTLDIDGCTPNITGWAKAGSYFRWTDGELKMLTADSSTNGSGETTLTFKPAIMTSPADNAPLSFTKATCTMILADDAQAMWECDKNGIYEQKTFTAFEVFA